MACCPTCGQAVPPLQIFIDNKYVVRGEASVRLNAQEMVVLKLLINASPHSMTKDRFIMAIYDDSEPEHPVSALRGIVCHLRRKIAPMGLEIRTHCGTGYSLHSDAEAMHEAKRLVTRRRVA